MSPQHDYHAEIQPCSGTAVRTTPHLAVAEASATGGKDEEVHSLDCLVGPEGEAAMQPLKRRKVWLAAGQGRGLTRRK